MLRTVHWIQAQITRADDLINHDHTLARSYIERRITRGQAHENGHTGVGDIELERSGNESQLSDVCHSGSMSPVLPKLQSRFAPFVVQFSMSASPSLEPACPTPDLLSLSPLSALAADADVTSLDHGSKFLQVDGKMVRSRCSDPDSEKTGCTYNSYMCGAGKGAVDHEIIYDTKQWHHHQNVPDGL